MSDMPPKARVQPATDRGAASPARPRVDIKRSTSDVPLTPPEDVPVFTVEDLSVYYGAFRAIRNVDMTVCERQITSFIGPSGCGKTTLLRCFNRMNDLVEIARVEGKILFHGVDLYHPDVNPVEVRRRIGMVFQKPNPFPKSIW
ncbi:MAG TPA: ATP-binding cassette domain-containing protein, partial [Actinomycetota bacterium]|nr:ATP-binding cassette domain-containing protein [Actinomycetota bacterium]